MKRMCFAVVALIVFANIAVAGPFRRSSCAKGGCQSASVLEAAPIVKPVSPVVVAPKVEPKKVEAKPEMKKVEAKPVQAAPKAEAKFRPIRNWLANRK